MTPDEARRENQRQQEYHEKWRQTQLKENERSRQYWNRVALGSVFSPRREMGSPQRTTSDSDGTLFRPRYFHVAGPRDAVLIIYDYVAAPISKPYKFHMMLNGQKLCSCRTSEGFFLRIALPLGSYRVEMRFGLVFRNSLGSDVHIDRPGYYGLRVLVGFDTVAFDVPKYHPWED